MRRICLAPAFAPVFLLAAHALSAQQPKSTASQRPAPGLPASRLPAPVVRIDYVEDSLPNGLRVLYHVDRSTPIVAVDITYDVGAKHEPAGRTGFAHLFEHMMLTGSRNAANGQHGTLLEAAGGHFNGSTWLDRTIYFDQVPSNQLELALWLEADRMGTLAETVDQKKLDIQRDVVKNERRARVDNQPYGTFFDNVMAAAFPTAHPYHHGVIGSMADLSAASLEDVRGFFRTYYAPNNAVLVIAGDVDVTEARRLVRKYFAAIPRGPAVPPVPSMAVSPHLSTAQRLVVPDAHAPSPAVYVAFRVPSARDSGWAAIPLLASVLADGKAGRLYAALVRERQLATEVFGFNFGLVDGADVMFFEATGRPDVDPAQLEQALLAVLDSARAGVTQAELDRVRAKARFRFLNQLQRMGGFDGRADLLAQGATYFQDPNWINTVLPHYDAVTVAQLRALAGERLVPANRITLVYLPTKDTTKAAGSGP